MDENKIRSMLIPNTFPFPNWIIDEGIWSLLVDQERTLYAIVIRKTLGWWKFTDRISKSQLMDFSGFQSLTVTRTMKSLVEFGLVLRISENDRSNKGIEWGYQPDHKLVRIDLLKERATKTKRKNEKRTQKARKAKKSGGGMSHIPPMSDIEGGGMSDIQDKTIIKPTNDDPSGSSSTNGKKPKQPRKATKKPVTVPDDWLGLYRAFVQGFGRDALDQSELRFWLFGSSGVKGGAKGIKHYHLAKFTPREVELAWNQIKREGKLTIKNPNSLFFAVDDIHRKANPQNDEGQTETLEERRERIRKRIQGGKSYTDLQKGS